MTFLLDTTLYPLLGILFASILATILVFRYFSQKRDKLYLKEIQSKNSEIKVLNKKIKALENRKNQFETSSKAEVKQWFDNSEQVLKNLDRLPEFEVQLIQEELRKRSKLMADFSLETTEPIFTVKEIEGTYNIIGLNQNKEQHAYYGFLHLTKIGKNRVNAEWVIGGEQTQVGFGFYHKNTLIINFSYEGELENITRKFKGVVVYKFISETILTGFWSEKHGDDDFLGFEEGRRIIEAESISYQARMN